MSRIAKEQKPLPQLDSIAERLERIDRVLDGTREQPLAAFGQLAEKMEKLESSLERVQSPGKSDELMAMLQQLSSRMSEAETRSDTHALDALQVEISRLGQKLDMPSGAPAGLEDLQRAVETLMGQFDTARSDLREAAADAAERAAREAIRSIARDDTTDTLAAEGLLLLKRDLGEFKSAQTEADRRTRQTLEALHSTLETLASRLSGMETSAPVLSEPRTAAPAPRSDVPPPVKTPPVMPSTAQPAMPPLMAEPSPRTETAAPAASMLAPRLPASADVLDDTADLPLEPGQRPGQPARPPAIPLLRQIRARISSPRRAGLPNPRRTRASRSFRKRSSTRRPPRPPARLLPPKPRRMARRSPPSSPAPASPCCWALRLWSSRLAP